MSVDKWQATTWEDEPVVLLSWIKGRDGVLITPGTVSAITRYIFDKDTPAAAALFTDIIASSAVLTTPLSNAQDPRWPADEDPYNFIDEIPATRFPNGNKTYLVEHIFTMVAGYARHLVGEVTTQDIRASV